MQKARPRLRWGDLIRSAQAAIRGAKRKRNCAELAARGESVVREFLKSLLYGLGRCDAATIAGAGGSPVAVPLLAAYLPARRALRIEAVTALRYE